MGKENNFNPVKEEGFMGKTPVDFLNFLFLQQIDETERAYIEYERLRYLNVDIPPIQFRAKLKGLYIKCMFGLRRWDIKAEQIHRAVIMSESDPSDAELIAAFEFILEWLDTIKVTRVDLKRKYDRRNWEIDNEEANL